MAISPHEQPGWRWQHPQPNGGYMVVDGSMVRYGPEQATTPPGQRPVMSSEYYQNMPYRTGPMPMQPTQQYHQQASFGPYGYHASSPIPPYKQHQAQEQQPQQQPMGRTMPSIPSLSSTQSQEHQSSHQSRSGSIDGSSSPSIKSESMSMMSTQTDSTYAISSAGGIKRSPASSPRTIIPIIPIGGASEIQFHTPIDNLMREIQAKRVAATGLDEEGVAGDETKIQEEEIKPPVSKTTSPAVPRHNRRIYKCTIPGCQRVCKQKTHLQIHIRSHTGEKPYVCHFPDCGKRFSQAGNLKTHYRRHTKERPFKCERCGKRFPQRGNLRSHMETHVRTVSFICKLGGCNKSFTARGNLKTHQNHFHLQIILDFHAKLRGMEISKIPREDIEMLQYLEDIHKNSNKGIKGRGKHAKVLPIHEVPVPNVPPYGAPVNHIAGPQNSQSHQSHHPVTPPIPHTTYMGHGSMMATAGPRNHYAMYERPATSAPPVPHPVMYNDQPRSMAFGNRMY